MSLKIISITNELTFNMKRKKIYIIIKFFFCKFMFGGLSLYTMQWLEDSKI